jgi:hypothetical protein
MGEDIALNHGKNDITAFEHVTSVSTAEKVDNPHNSKIINAFNFFLEHIDVDSLDVMTVMMNAQFVRIDLDADEDEQQIFDTINSLGVNLTISELLKNYFFSRETIKEYEEKWAAVFECDTETKAYWEKQIEAGRTKRARIIFVTASSICASMGVFISPRACKIFVHILSENKPKLNTQTILP